MNLVEGQLSKPKKNRTFLALYIIALFSAAAIIILISYLYNARIDQSAEELEASRQLSVSALQSVETLRDDNIELQAKIAEAEEKIAELESELAEYETQLEAQQGKTRSASNMLADTQKKLDDITKLYNELLQGEETDD